MKKLLIALSLVFTANAGFLVEPLLGYTLGKLDTNLTSGGEIPFTTNGVELGARVGYTLPLLMFGLDYRMNQLSNEYDGNAVDVTALDQDSTHIGAFVGVELPILLRAWASYYFSSSYENPAGDKTKGSGFALGAGFTGLPFVSLNLEYRVITLDELESASGTVTSYPSGGIDDISANEIVLSVSLPLDL